MKNSISGMLALALLIGACGDDSGDSKDKDNTGDAGRNDAGGGAIDGGADAGIDSAVADTGTPGTDSGSGSDASTGLTLEQALVTSGVNTSVERARLLFPPACKNNEACSPDPECVQTALEQYNNGLAAGFSSACLDATLDLYACFAKEADCTKYTDECGDLNDVAGEACAAYTDDDAGLPSMMP